MATVWKEFKTNKKSVGELWLEFLCYYTDTFNFEENVISVTNTSVTTTVKTRISARLE